MKHWHAQQLGATSKTRFVTWGLSHVSERLRLCIGTDEKATASALTS